MAALKTKNANEKKHSKPRHRLERQKTSLPKSSLVTAGVLAAMILAPAASVPANASPANLGASAERASESSTLDLSAISLVSSVTADSNVKLNFASPIITSTPAPKPEPKPVVAAQSSEANAPVQAANAQAAPAAAETPVAGQAGQIAQAASPTQAAAAPVQVQKAPAQAASPTPSPAVGGSRGAAIAAGALAQLGAAQDCTDLVQNSLAAAGLVQRRDQGGPDMGTGIEQYDRFGSRVSINALAPGDILIYGYSHVAIYIGDGKAVHGGFNGANTVVFSANVPGQAITGAIRV